MNFYKTYNYVVLRMVYLRCSETLSMGDCMVNDENLAQVIVDAKVVYGRELVCTVCGPGVCSGNLSFNIHTETEPAWKFFLKDIISKMKEF